MACFSDLRLSAASSSLEASFPSPPFSLKVLTGLRRVGTGLNRFDKFSDPVIAGSLVLGPGVEKSIKSSSPAFFLGDLFGPFPVPCFRLASKDGIACGGVSGTLGFKIDLIGTDGDGCKF